MYLRDKTLDQLEELELELLNKDEEVEKWGYYSDLIFLYEEMHQKLIRLSRKNKKEDRDRLQYVKYRLVSYLINYGSYLKKTSEKDDRLAKDTLIKALKYDFENPIAHYRLGFLAYKRSNFLEAVSYFQKAMQFQKKYPSNEFKLNKQQRYYAQLYLSSSALYVAKQAQELVEELKDEVEEKAVTNLELSPLLEKIRENEAYLREHEFTITTPDGVRMCPKRECEDIAEDFSLFNTIILYFSDRKNLLIFNGREEPLEPNYAEMLRHYLLYSNEEFPVTKDKIYDIFQSGGITGEVADNTYTQKIIRLRRKLAKVGAPTSLIGNKRVNNQTGYYYNHAFPFMIMHRADENFILDNKENVNI